MTSQVWVPVFPLHLLGVKRGFARFHIAPCRQQQAGTMCLESQLIKVLWNSESLSDLPKLCSSLQRAGCLLILISWSLRGHQTHLEILTHLWTLQPVCSAALWATGLEMLKFTWNIIWRGGERYSAFGVEEWECTSKKNKIFLVLMKSRWASRCIFSAVQLGSWQLEEIRLGTKLGGNWLIQYSEVSNKTVGFSESSLAGKHWNPEGEME